MLFMEPSKFPAEPHSKYMETKSMHLFNGIQIACFAMLLVFRSIKVIAIAFHIIIKLCIPIRRYILAKIFSTEELILVDTDELTVDEYKAYKKSKTADPENGFLKESQHQV